MSIDLDTVLRVLDACDAIEGPPLISFVFPKKGGGSGQVFLEWKQGRSVRDYIRDPLFTNTLSLYQAAYSRILDHRNIRRRLTHVPKPGDELRFIRASPIGEM